MNRCDRRTVANAIKGVCEHRGWWLLASHIRSNHWHAVVEADKTPEHVMTTLKSYATQALQRVDGVKRPRWARHGSTRYLWERRDVNAAIEYVVAGQGDPMEVYEARDCG